MNWLQDTDNYERRVRELELQGMTTSDAQAVADADWAIQDMESIIDALNRNQSELKETT